jgi:hypothetical protein
VCAQMDPETISKLHKMQQAHFQNLEKRWMLSTGRNQLGEVIELHNHFGRDMSPDMGVPGARLAREAYVDIYAHNYNGAIPLLQKAIQLGNEDAMLYLSYCYWYGHGVPANLAKALQLQRTVGIANARRVVRIDREQQEERARSAREFERAVARASENAEAGSKSQSSTYRSSATVPKIYNPFPPPMGHPPFGTTEKYIVVPWGSTVGQGE